MALVALFHVLCICFYCHQSISSNLVVAERSEQIGGKKSCQIRMGLSLTWKA